MKNKLFLVLIAIFMFMGFTNVNALDLTQAMFDAVEEVDHGVKVGRVFRDEANNYYLDPGDYTLSEDININNIIFNGGESTLNLNNKTLMCIVITEGAKLTIEGDGVVGGVGVYSSGYEEEIGSEVIVKGGTYIDFDLVDSKLIIENATVEGEYHGITLGSGADVEINGGTFNVGPEGIALEVGEHYS